MLHAKRGFAHWPISKGDIEEGELREALEDMKNLLSDY